MHLTSILLSVLLFENLASATSSIALPAEGYIVQHCTVVYKVVLILWGMRNIANTM